MNNPHDHPQAARAPAPQYDPDSVSFNPKRRSDSAEREDWSLLGVIADIRAAVGDRTGRIMLGELAAHIRELVDGLREELNSVHELIARTEPGKADLRSPDDIPTAELADMLARAYDTTRSQRDAWRDVGDAFDCDSPAALAAYIDTLADERRNARALADKLEHLLDSRAHECEALRSQLDASGADMVNHPPHYQGKVECIDAIETALGGEGFAAYCRGNAIKYAFRAGKKGAAAQDLAKARWYLERAAA